MTKIEKVEAFSEELSKIPVESIRNWTAKCIELIPDYFFEIGASSTGKHHPYWSKGPGGTLRHTKALVRAGTQLAGTFAKSDPIIVAKIQAAGLLHDSCKYGLTYDVRMYDLHPYIPRALFKNVPYEFGDNDREIIFRAIEAHMGNATDGTWSLLPYVTVNTLREESVAHVVHLADYLVSREDYVDPRFVDCTQEHKSYELYSDEMIYGLFYARLLIHLKDVALSGAAAADDALRASILTRVRALDKASSKTNNLYHYDEIIKTIDSNITWMAETNIKDIEARLKANVR